jgi:hypothetical protein
MKKEDIKIGLKVKYDNKVMQIIDYFPQVKNTSPSGDVLLGDFEGNELVNHNEIEILDIRTDCRYFRTFGRCAVDNKEPNCENCGCYTFKYSRG